MTSAASDSPETFNVLAEGFVYSIQVETIFDDLDWLDKVLLRVTQDKACSLQELFAALVPLPRRLVENALARLLERNVMLLDIYDGSVRASPLNEKPESRRSESFQVWQDHSSGMIVPRELIRSFESGQSRSDDIKQPSLRLGGGPPKRTPLEMSSTELLHQLRRVQNRIDPRAEIRGTERTDRVSLDIRTVRREDGRYAFLDRVPWRLRAAWARVSGLQTVTDTAESDAPLPVHWDQVVGRWAQDVYDRILKQPRRRQTAASSLLLQILASDLSIRLVTGGTAVTKQMAREAKRSAVVAVFGGHGNPGDAVQILIEAPVAERTLVVGSAPPESKLGEWRKQSIRVISTGHQEGPDFVLIDGVNLALGGIRGDSSGVITMHARAPLEGVVAWLDTIGVPIVREQQMAASDLTTDVQELEYELLDLLGESPAQRQGQERAEEAIASIRQHLTNRCGSIEARLQRRNPLSFTWLSAAEVLALVEEWRGTLRIIARTESSPLVAAAARRNADCAVWPATAVSADCVILDSIVILGFAVSDSRWSAPEFLAIADSDLARKLKMETSLLRVGA